MTTTLTPNQVKAQILKPFILVLYAALWKSYFGVA